MCIRDSNTADYSRINEITRLHGFKLYSPAVKTRILFIIIVAFQPLRCIRNSIPNIATCDITLFNLLFTANIFQNRQRSDFKICNLFRNYNTF